jgi:hypothetical protein
LSQIEGIHGGDKMKSNTVNKLSHKVDFINDLKATKKTLKKEEKILNRIIKYCVKIENGFADGLFPEDMKIMATVILDMINEK